jgi:hypothetical protein
MIENSATSCWAGVGSGPLDLNYTGSCTPLQGSAIRQTSASPAFPEAEPGSRAEARLSGIFTPRELDALLTHGRVKTPALRPLDSIEDQVRALRPRLSGCDLARVRIAADCKGVNGSKRTRDTASPPPASKAMPSMRTRGEDAMPRTWTAAVDLCGACDRQAKSDGIAGGGDGPHARPATPTRCVQRLGPAVAPCRTVGDGRSKPRTHRPPLSCVTKAPPSSQGEAQRAEPDSRALRPGTHDASHLRTRPSIMNLVRCISRSGH